MNANSYAQGKACADWISTTESLPREGEPVLYRTLLYQAMGSIDGLKRWRFSTGDLEAMPVLFWTPLISEQ